MEHCPISRLTNNTWIRPLVYKRAFHAYGVGLPRTGTKFLSHLFAGRFRSAHEPRCGELLQLAELIDSGQSSPAAIEKALKTRDRRLWLEMDSSSLNRRLIGHLADLFPTSKFILTVREPHSWLGSILDLIQSAAITRDSRVASLPYWRLSVLGERAPVRYTKAERLLEDRGLPPVEDLLKWWTLHNRRILEGHWTDRLLVIQTANLSRETTRLGEFLGVKPDHLNSGIPRGTGEWLDRAGLAASIDDGFLQDQISEHCHELMPRLFPDGAASGAST